MKSLGLILLIALGGFMVYNQYKIPQQAAIVEAVIETPAPEPFRILLVPGHDTKTGGTQYKGLYERDIAVTVAEKIAAGLSTTTYDVMIARNTEEWNPVLQDYFTKNEDEIIAWKSDLQMKSKERLTSGEKKFVPDMATHSEVDKKTSVQLYGINKWVNENDIDLTLHIHFNGSGDRSHSGFTVFIPESQHVNSTTSRAIAQYIYDELKTSFTPESDLPLLEDQSLIALGASDTLEKPAVLIEYAYIYETMLQKPTEREKTLTEMAARTVAGILAYRNE